MIYTNFQTPFWLKKHTLIRELFDSSISILRFIFFRSISGYGSSMACCMKLEPYWHRITTVLLIISHSFNLDIYAIYLYRYMTYIWHISDWYMTDIWRIIRCQYRAKTVPFAWVKPFAHKNKQKCTYVALNVFKY